MLIINGSPRKEGCSARVIPLVAETVEKYGYGFETVNICDLDVNGCKACMSCKKTGECVQKDDMTQLYGKLRDADMVMLTTPVYFAAETGQLKCFIDRLYAMVKRVDGERIVNFGKPKIGTVFISCGAADGAMLYCNILTRITGILRSFGVTDFSSVIVPAADPENIRDSDYVKDYLGAIEFQLDV